MANFKTHLLIAATVSGVASVVVIATDLVAPLEVGRYFPLGVVGGLLPDIDSDHSLPTKLFFSFLALCAAFFAVVWALPVYSLAELGVIWLGIFIFVRYFVFEAFVRLTVHRGVFHSLLATIFFGLLTVNVCYHLLESSVQGSWLSGCFVAMGYFVHLSLDEIYSVDLMNSRVKRSFGTALKLISVSNFKSSLLMMVCAISLYTTSPNPASFWVKINQTVDLYSAQDKWLPKNNRWFTGLSTRLLSCASS